MTERVADGDATRLARTATHVRPRRIGAVPDEIRRVVAVIERAGIAAPPARLLPPGVLKG